LLGSNLTDSVTDILNIDNVAPTVHRMKHKSQVTRNAALASHSPGLLMLEEQPLSSCAKYPHTT
jgi:hypothetical protein